MFVSPLYFISFLTVYSPGWQMWTRLANGHHRAKIGLNQLHSQASTQVLLQQLCQSMVYFLLIFFLCLVLVNLKISLAGIYTVYCTADIGKCCQFFSNYILCTPITQYSKESVLSILYKLCSVHSAQVNESILYSHASINEEIQQL